MQSQAAVEHHACDEELSEVKADLNTVTDNRRSGS